MNRSRSSASFATAASDAAENTAPVGLFGLLSTITFVRGVTAARNRPGSRSNPVVSDVGTATGTAPTSRACSGYETQNGLGTSTSSAGLSIATARLNSVCLAPHETRTSAGSYARPLSRLNLAHTAARSSGTPPTSVYFVWPRRIAWIAASLIRSGVSKSGSPAPNEITSTPRRRNSRALACTASVDDGASVFRRSASTAWLLRRRTAALLGRVLLGQSFVDNRRHHAGHRRAEAGDFLDQARRDVRVLLVRHQEHRLDRAPELPVHQRHLELVLEIGDGADPPHDAVGPFACHQVDQKPVERDDAKVAQLRGGLVDHLESFFHREERLLRGIGDHRDDELVEDLEAALDDVDVAVVDRIEHTGIDSALGHGGRLPFGSKESQGRLPESSVPERPQPTVFARETTLGQMLGDDESPPHGELARAERLERALAGVGRVRRVEEGDLEPPALGFEPRELPSDVAAHDTRPGLDTERPDILLERRDRARVALDERRMRGAARERLEPDAARAREEIEHAGVGQPGPERVHQRDPHLIGRRARRRAARRHQPPPLQRSRDHPHCLKSEGPRRPLRHLPTNARGRFLRSNHEAGLDYS